MCQDKDWRMQEKSLSERVLYIFSNNLWCDCKFSVGKGESIREFSAHKFVLSLASPVFEKMFAYNQSSNDIAVEDIEPESFATMLNYAYGSEVEITSFDRAKNLYYVAHKYIMPDLLEKSNAYLLKDIDVSTACEGYEFAKLFNQLDLMEKSKEVICDQTSDVIQNSSFLEVQLSTLQMILDEEHLQIESEVELFEAISMWTRKEFERLDIVGAEFEDKHKSIYDQLTPKMCFLTMEPKEFAAGPASSPLLAKDQSLAVLMNIVHSDCDCPLPEGFTTRVRKLQKVYVEKSLELYFPDKKESDVRAPYTSTLKFSCDTNVTILGVEMWGMMLCGPDRVEEEFVEIVLTARDGSHGEGYFSSLDVHQSSFAVYFSSPVPLRKTIRAKLNIHLKGTGYYRIGVLRSGDSKPEKFTFYNGGKRCLMIERLIYSKWRASDVEQPTDDVA